MLAVYKDDVVTVKETGAKGEVIDYTPMGDKTLYAIKIETGDVLFLNNTEIEK